MGAEDSAPAARLSASPSPGGVDAPPQIRPATAADACAIVDLLATIGIEGTLGVDPSTLRVDEEAARLAHLDLRTACALVVAIGGLVRGFAVAVRGTEPPIAHTATVSVAVAADSRRRGCGRLLLGGLSVWARAAGLSKLCAGVVDRNDPALALFHRAGYAVEGIRRGQLALGGRLADEIMFGLRLQPLPDGDGLRPRHTRGTDGRRRNA